jgi:hypothetical protein
MIFLILLNNFDIKNLKKSKKNILIYFQEKNTFKKYISPQYQTHTYKIVFSIP